MNRRPPLPDGPFLVLGLARAGQAAVDALARIVGPEQVRAWDGDTGTAMQRRRRELESVGVRTQLGSRPSPEAVRWARVVVKSPGIPFDSPALRAAAEHGREVMDELEIGWRLTRAPMLAVTGTNGKSTVCGLALAALTAAGHRARLAGNTLFGPPLSTVGSESLDLDWVVGEVSSFQLEGRVSLLPELAVLTNLTPEHLDRHGTLAHYGEIKRRLFVDGAVVAPRAVVDVDGLVRAGAGRRSGASGRAGREGGLRRASRLSDPYGELGSPRSRDRGEHADRNGLPGQRAAGCAQRTQPGLGAGDRRSDRDRSSLRRPGPAELLWCAGTLRAHRRSLSR